MTDKQSNADAISRELVTMAAEDLWVRAELAADGSLFDGYHPRMEAIHKRNAARLRVIIERVGWPGRAVFGEDASRAAWLILQHAIGEPDFQRQGLGRLQAAAAEGDVPAVEVAMLEDRIRVFEGRPQRYGTQLDEGDDGTLVPFPIEDHDGVDARRAGVGLPPLEETLRDKQAMREAEGPPSSGDRAERQRRYEEWLKQVGWRS